MIELEADADGWLHVKLPQPTVADLVRIADKLLEGGARESMAKNGVRPATSTPAPVSKRRRPQ